MLIFQKINEIKLTFFQGVIALFSIYFLRTFFESLINILHENKLPDLIFFITQSLWFFTAFVGIAIIISIVNKERITNSSKFIIFLSLIIFIPLLIDGIFINNERISYNFQQIESIYDLVISYLTFFSGKEVSIGLKIATLVLFILTSLYVWQITRSPKKIILTNVSIYTFLFLLTVFPSLLFWGHTIFCKNDHNILGIPYTESSFYYFINPAESSLQTQEFITNISTEESLRKTFIVNHIGRTFSIFTGIIMILCLALWLRLYNKDKFFAVIKNFQYLRASLFFLLIILGIFLAIFQRGYFITSMTDFFILLSLFLGFFFAGLFCVWENDEEDIEIDKITNRHRPLPRKILSIEEWRIIKHLFFLLSVLFSFLAGYYPLLIILTFIFLYHIYSVRPFRFKRYPVISSIIIGLVTSLAFSLGFFIASEKQTISEPLLKYSLGIFLFFLLIENFKNIKDIEGDRQEGIKTIPSIFGPKKGRIITGILAFFSAISLPLVFLINIYTIITAIVFGLIFYFLITKEKYSEKYVFISIYLYLIIFFFEFFLSNI